MEIEGEEMMAKLQDATGNTVDLEVKLEEATPAVVSVPAGTDATPAMWRKMTSQYNLHVLLITEQDSLTLNKARTLAWAEGAAGLKARIARPETAH